MFLATRDLGGLAVSLAYFRGFREFAATPFLTDAEELARRMTGVTCLGGQTQILRTLRHALAETRGRRSSALVLIGDAIEEDVDPICHAAGELGLRGTPVFCFQEGAQPGRRPTPSARSRSSPAAPGRPSTPQRPGRCGTCCAPSRSSPPAGARRWRGLPSASARAIAGQLPAPRRAAR